MVPSLRKPLSLSTYLHLVMGRGDNEVVSSKQTQSLLFLGDAGAEHRHMKSKSLAELNRHVAKPTKPNHAKRFTRLVHIVTHHGSIDSDASA